MNTNKFELKEIQLSDAPEVFNIIEKDREYLREWLPFIDFTTKVEDTAVFIRGVRMKASDMNNVFVIVNFGRIAGVISYKGTDTLNHKTEIGYWLAKDYQGKGFITRSCIKLIDNAFDTMKMNRVQIKTGVCNTKSSAVPKRLDFTFEGIEREGEYLNGRYIDLEIYSMLKLDWQKNRNRYETH
jgi:ribosomal-protein-serine acetyltransferase